MSKVCYVFLGLRLDDSAVELRRLLSSGGLSLVSMRPTYRQLLV